MNTELKNVIEALLFASDTPVSLQKLKEIVELDTVTAVRKAIEDLNDFYEKNESALTVVEVAGGYQIVSRKVYAGYVQKLFKGRQASRLTQRALETLAIIAYKQPITKNEIENIRGVNVDGVIKTLLERNLVTIEGREKAPGSPLLYGTTKYFLEYFGLKSTDDLPKLKEIDELLKEDTKFLESLDQVALRQLDPAALGLSNLKALAEAETDEELSDTAGEESSDIKEEKSADDKIE